MHLLYIRVSPVYYRIEVVGICGRMPPHETFTRFTPNAKRARETAKRWPQSTHPKTLKSSRGPRRGSRLGSSWLWWGGWRCGQWLRGWWGWKLRGGGCPPRSRRPLRGISLPLTRRGGGVNNSPACASVGSTLSSVSPLPCSRLCQLARSFSYFLST